MGGVCGRVSVLGWGWGVGVWCGFVVYRCHEGACGPHGCVRVGCACGCGAAETEAERHSQAKDNAVCVLGGAGRGPLPLPQSPKTVLYICVSFAVSHTGLLLPSF